MNEQTVVVKYRTKKQYCSCCNQKLPKAETSKFKEFEFNKESTAKWTNWNAAAEYPEDMDNMVPEYVYDTIRFFAVGAFEKVIIDNSEIEKVRDFILREVVGYENRINL